MDSWSNNHWLKDHLKINIKVGPYHCFNVAVWFLKFECENTFYLIIFKHCT